ncbi:MAG: accessory gene regulator B family protein [Ruminococcus flavefaciens]|nr:accessory gene regulator B family protein [Ruminococcus flavefaciens]
MSERLARIVTDFLVREKAVQPEEAEIYDYGFNALFFDAGQTVLFLLIGICVHCFWQTVLFLTVFASLRKYAGGFHAETRIGCTCMSCTFLGIVLVVTSRGSIFFEGWFTYFLCSVFYGMCFYTYAPVEHQNKPLTKQQKNSYRRQGAWLSVVWLVIAVIARVYQSQIGDCIVSTMAIVAISIIMGKERREIQV